MSGLEGALQQVHLSRTLALLVLAPLVRGLLELSFGARLRRPAAVTARVLGWALAQLSLVSWHVFQMVEAPGPPMWRLVLQSLGSVARVGSLDVEVALGLDAKAGGLVALIIVGTSVAQLVAPRSAGGDRPVSPRLSFVAAGATLAVLADGFAPLVVGITVTGIASAAFARADGQVTLRAASATLGSAMALVCSAAVLFWTLGGSWGIPLGWDVEYTRRDPQPQFAPTESLSLNGTISGNGSAIHPVALKQPLDAQSPRGRAFLTMTALPGSRVFLAGADAPVASSPFVRLELAAGELDVEIETTTNGPRIRLPHVKLAEGEEVALTPLGPTLGFRALRDQLVLIDAAHEPVVRRILDASAPFHREIWGRSATGLALAFVLVAVLGMLAQWPLHGWLLEASEGAPLSSSIALGAMPLIGVHVLARCEFLFALVPAAKTTAVGLGLLGAALGGASALARNPASRRFAYLAVSFFGLSLSLTSTKSSGGVLALVAVVCLVLGARRTPESAAASDLVDGSILARSDRVLRRAFFELLRALTVLVALVERGVLRRVGRIGLLCLVPVVVLGLERAAVAADVTEVRAYAGTLVIVEAGPLELDGEGRAQFTLKNTSDAPLLVTSLYGRTTERDPRIPGTLTASFDGGAAKGPIEAGASRVVHLVWDRSGARLTQLFAHVVVESTDAATPQMAIGVVGRAPGPLAFVTSHVLGILVALPLLAALGSLLVVVLPAGSRHVLVVGRGLGLGATGAQLGLAVWIVRGFDGSVGRADGNDGLQFLEHARLTRGLACEWFVGVDGIGVAMVVLTALVGFVGVVVARPAGPRATVFFPLFLLLLAGLMVGFCAIDAVLFTASSSAALVALTLLVAFFGGAGRRRAARKLALATVVGGGMLLFGFVALARHAEPTFLVDGARTLHSFAAPELARVDFLGQGAQLFGRPLVLAAFAALFVGFALQLALAPLHGWLPDVVAEAPPAVGLVVLALVTRLGLHGLLRFAFAILPEATRWAAPTLAILGVVQIFYGAFAALGCEGRQRTLAYLSMTHVGFAVLGASSLTPQGLSGALASASGQALSLGLAMLVVDLLARRGIADDEAITPVGRAAELPRLAALFALALLASSGAPGLVGFVGAGLSVFGAFPVYRVLSLSAALGFVVTLVPHGALFARTFSTAGARAGDTESEIADVTRRELSAYVPIALAIVALGLHPRPLLDAPRGSLGELGIRLNPGGVALTSPDRERPSRFPRRGRRAGCSPSSSA